MVVLCFENKNRAGAAPSRNQNKQRCRKPLLYPVSYGGTRLAERRAARPSAVAEADPSELAGGDTFSFVMGARLKTLVFEEESCVCAEPHG